MLRSLGVIVFVAIVGATGIYFANRPTVARGAVIAADLLTANPAVEAITCDKEIPFGVDGATFHCAIELKDGRVGRAKFIYDRNGAITEAPQENLREQPDDRPIGKTTDPWGD